MHSKARRSADILVAAAVVLVALAPASGVASIQATELSGTVIDATGIALTGVVVKARPAGAVAPVQTALTDRTGMFTLGALEPGPYDVTFTLPGFNEVRARGCGNQARWRDHPQCRNEGRDRGAGRGYREPCSDADSGPIIQHRHASDQ